MARDDTDHSGIEAEGLVREFKGGIRAVDELDLEVAAGEIYGFLGPNGAGKTTCVRILTTLLRPTSGSALVAGHDVVHEADAVRRSIGVALQEAAIDPLMTGRELLRMQGALHGLRAAPAQERARELLRRVGLTEAADRRVGGYSGGMRRRLDLALALVHRPDVLFLDEPTTGLDPTSRPAAMIPTRSASCSASSRYCVVRKTVVPSSLSARTSRHSAARLVGSSPVVGSSRKSTGGRCTSASARSRRRRMPPE